MKKQSLGRGLGAILGEIEETYTKEISNQVNNFSKINLDDIKPNPFQPRKKFDKNSLQELSKSIQEHGQIQPILIAKDQEHFVIIAGERRYRAIKLLNQKTINAIIVDYDIQKLQELSIIENIQREDLNPIELALSYKQLIDTHKLTQDELSERLNKSRTLITNTLRLLKLSDYVKQMVIDAKISAGHAKIIVSLDDKEQKIITDTIIGQNLSVRATEELVLKMKNYKSVDKQKQKEIDNFKIEKTLAKEFLKRFKKFGINAKVSSNKITIDINSISDTQTILDLLKS